MNERSLLPVLVAASPGSSLVTRFQAAAADMLLRLGVRATIVEAERREVEEVRFGKTASRQVLGVMTDFSYLMDAFRNESMELIDIAMKLADAPCGHIRMKRPMAVAVDDALVAPTIRARARLSCAVLHGVDERRGAACLDGGVQVRWHRCTSRTKRW